MSRRVRPPRWITSIGCCLAFLMLLPVAAAARPSPEALDELAGEFWAWRARTQPFSGDDIPRIERPADWLPDWSPAGIAAQRRELEVFERRWKLMDARGWPVSRQVDYRLIGSALARVRWELEILQRWRHNPYFYIDQTLGSIFEPLLPPPPFDAQRSRTIVRRLQAMPQTLEHARVNLDQPQAPFARLAISALTDVRGRLGTMQRGLQPLLDASSAAQLPEATEKAIVALEAYRAWLKQRLPQMPEKTAVGRDAYMFFLKHVALIPFTPEQLLAMGKQEWDRAVSFEAYEQQRNQGLPQLPLFPDQEAQMEREKRAELAVRRFLEEKGILSVPSWVKHYRNLPLPPYLEPLSFLGVTADHTSATRLGEDGVSYIRPPSPNLGYFGLSTARDPRPILVHEGVPGHYFQLVLSWAQENPIRRHYYDSGPNEGLGFYAEEMMLQAGYFDDSPRTREIIYNFMRLRALRVEADVRLALGEFSIGQAAEYLRTAVPMDAETAHEEAASFAAGPGQAITYQIGKLQILELLAAARRAQGVDFRLRDFHDFLWKNGNVPLALQRWEYLGLDDQVKELDRE
ncbi:MAG TPA: DUF885 family protein [Terriglobales bacterium]|nr:DUF885 family protein [Terriglobales bacterium]